MIEYIDTTTIDSPYRTRTIVSIDPPQRNPDFDSVYICYRFKPTGDVGRYVTVQGRKDAQEYIAAMTENDPRYEWWLEELPGDSGA